MSKQVEENTILFKKDHITIYLTRAIYNAIEKIARTKYKDSRSILGVIQTYAVIQLYSRLSFTNKFVPIHRDIFQYISKRNYIDYRELLCQHNIIEYRKSEISSYKTIKGENRISSTTTEYRMAGIIGGIWDFDKTIPVHIKMPVEYVTALEDKHLHIKEEYIFSQEKSKSIMEINPVEIIVVKHIAQLVKEIISNKISTKRTLDKKITIINQFNSRITAVDDIEVIVKRLIRVVYNKHIAEYKLAHLFSTQSVKHNRLCNIPFFFYQELKVEDSALDGA